MAPFNTLYWFILSLIKGGLQELKQYLVLNNLKRRLVLSMVKNSSLESPPNLKLVATLPCEKYDTYLTHNGTISLFCSTL